MLLYVEPQLNCTIRDFSIQLIGAAEQLGILPCATNTLVCQINLLQTRQTSKPNEDNMPMSNSRLQLWIKFEIADDTLILLGH